MYKSTIIIVCNVIFKASATSIKSKLDKSLDVIKQDFCTLIAVLGLLVISCINASNVGISSTASLEIAEIMIGRNFQTLDGFYNGRKSETD